MTNFWADKLGGQAPPPHLQQTAPPQQQSAWWAPPTPTAPAQTVPGQAAYNVPYTYDQLKAMRADEMSQDQMELLAEYELQFEKYNNHCPNCGSTNYVKQGDRIGGVRMPTDKCFECGGSQSALTGSPEPAVGVTGNKANSISTRQTANGGLQSGYGHHHSALPQSYLPTRG